MTYHLSDLHHIVPAVTPAWIRIIAGETFTEDDSTIREWQDAVIPVLAYASLPGGFGAYLVCHDIDGPVWCIARRQVNAGQWFDLELHLSTKPVRGTPPSVMPSGFTYRDQPLPDLHEFVEWIVD